MYWRFSCGGNRSYFNPMRDRLVSGQRAALQERPASGQVRRERRRVEQDDYVSQVGSAGFHPPDALRVDNSVMRTGSGQTVRLPYLKLPRHQEF